MLIKKIFFDNSSIVICPVCEAETRSVRFVYYYNEVQHKIYQCQDCGFMFLRPVVLINLGNRQMDSIDDAEFFNNPFLKTLHERLIINREINLVRRHLGEGKYSLLDIGCGTGWTTHVWQKKGFEVVGLEPSRARSEAIKQRFGFRVITDYLENLTIDEKFNIIIMRHVLEHFEDPMGMIRKVRSLLKRKGILLVVVPNINSIGRYIFGTKWSWVLPYHCNYFNPKTLGLLIKRGGFDVMKIYQTPSPLFYPQSFLNLFPKSSVLIKKIYSRLSLLTLMPFAPIVLLGYLLNLSDNLTIMARAENRYSNSE